MIEVEDLHKRYRHVKAVDGLTFTAKPGEVTGFLGPNGAGKTTTIDMVLGLARPDGGEARIAGKPFHALEDPAGTVGAVLAGGAFHDRRSAHASLHATAVAAGIPATRIAEVLKSVGLADAPNRHVGAYSLGMRQRLSLAQALLGDPDVLILDEPGNGLDPAGLKWLRDTLRGLAHDRGKTVMLSSHILSEVQETVDVAEVIAEGALVREFSLAEA
ncbi:MAG: ATP-binding cassette domain-containing protein, partial [Solirubrobacterales bacterium]